LTFPVVKLLDYCKDLTLLETSNNPFAIVVLAHLQSQLPRRDPQTAATRVGLWLTLECYKPRNQGIFTATPGLPGSTSK
jgi:hypothetical protein